MSPKIKNIEEQTVLFLSPRGGTSVVIVDAIDSTVELTIEDSSMPALFRHADKSAKLFQSRYRRLVLFLVMTASSTSLLGIFSSSRIRMAIALGVTSIQLGTMLINSSLGWNKKWYQARALAESSKSLTWRFAVGGLPFPASISVHDAREQLSESMLDLIETVGEPIYLSPKYLPETENMSLVESIRQSQLVTRQNIYVQKRLRDQEVWYGKKTQSLNRMRQKLNALTIVSSACAILGSLALLVNPEMFEYAFISFFASMALGAITIGQSYNLATDITAYQITHYEIKRILSLKLPVDENAWAQWVDDNEEALSREHVMWLASRSRVGTVKKKI